MNNLTFPILRLLADGHFQSGEAIARHFGVTRATVWNALQEAEAVGVQLFSVRGRGYRLPQPITLLEHDSVLAAIGEQRSWFTLEVHDYLESTNGYLVKQAAAGAAHATCVAASLQTKGRGRRGRVWQAGLGASLTFSLLWRFQTGAAALSGLSLAVGVAIIRALHALGLPQAKLKWPNDILVHMQKMAGILIELQGDMEGPSAAVIGIGINLRLPEHLRRNIDQPATDLQHELKQAPNPNLLLGVLLKNLADVLSEFERNGFEALREEWLQHHAFQNQAVRLLLPDGRETQGVISSIAADGVLLVETAAGLQRFSAGEISLRGVTQDKLP
ncbi:MAG TPA: biotin--[acetyl-CoA-carboxylase] ligase [Methylophilaceae bacterium]|nr:biotin--[acetyl-CoA-carboxylase] ligase [Methylophilaceae bacterium]